MISLSGGLVEIAGRLVGDDDGGIGRQRAGERDALLLAAGQLGRIMIEAAAKPDRGNLALRACECVVRAGKLERHGDVLQRRHGRNQVEGLEDDADILAAETRESSSLSLRRSSRRPHRAGVGRSSPVITISSVDLPEPDGPEQADGFAAPYIEVDVSQDMNAGGAAAERQVDAAQRNGGAAERMPRSVMHVSG